jgi:hypothetical protein
MGLGYQFDRACKTLHNLDTADRCALEDICRNIQRAEDELNAAAADAFKNCKTACLGICCRNVDLDAVLGFPDFVYILTMAPQLAADTALCLENEPALYVSDCIFLENGTGPCIFPGNVMPEVCITTFCSEESAAQNEIKRLKWQFFRLNWFLHTLKLRAALRFVGKRLKQAHLKT